MFGAVAEGMSIGSGVLVGGCSVAVAEGVGDNSCGCGPTDGATVDEDAKCGGASGPQETMRIPMREKSSLGRNIKLDVPSP
jgi:hypothetical protein